VNGTLVELKGKVDWSQLCLSAEPDPLSVPVFLLVCIAGALSWTFIEYLLHRFVFHMTVDTASAWSISFHFFLHGQHHKFPLDPGRLVFPPVPAFCILVPIYLTATAIFTSNTHLAHAAVAGIILGYITYDLTHYYLHHGSPSLGYFQRLKARHMVHHFNDHQIGMPPFAIDEPIPKPHLTDFRIVVGYGLSSSLWDIILDTLPPQTLVDRHSGTKKPQSHQQ
jgi:4-hydroxysphinganine ceramide fatty acyl 2-hydroxylase